MSKEIIKKNAENAAESKVRGKENLIVRPGD